MALWCTESIWASHFCRDLTSYILLLCWKDHLEYENSKQGGNYHFSPSPLWHGVTINESPQTSGFQRFNYKHISIFGASLSLMFSHVFVHIFSSIFVDTSAGRFVGHFQAADPMVRCPPKVSSKAAPSTSWNRGTWQRCRDWRLVPRETTTGTEPCLRIWAILVVQNVGTYSMHGHTWIIRTLYVVMVIRFSNQQYHSHLIFRASIQICVGPACEEECQKVSLPRTSSNLSAKGGWEEVLSREWMGMDRNGMILQIVRASCCHLLKPSQIGQDHTTPSAW